ncbi:amino acid transporter, AAT family [Thermoactinomyces sp. DSM 45891]|uniref:amino acid permease n=1 Tax=Thermoactinomyces sp. DSM 45891 TaxID=1761907 RepID=UPI00091496BA|nr:amino acid permease [Thermoactinomyces sp. DSM 45891]SFX20943.1 amino acid transporter, AAT family [Thermoactinomyces sp. DSM 45891]
MSQGLARSLSARQLRMMAIGGTIGAGIFMGSADTINLAGPGIVFVYLLAGLLLYVVMGALAEMGSAYPDLDVKGMIHRAFGGKVSFVTGWLYYFNWVLVLAAEVVAAGTFLHVWFPQTPIWFLSTLCALFILILNLASVKLFGEIEFWLSIIKVVTILLFVGLGAYLLFSNQEVGLSNYTQHGGFFPTGLGGLATAVTVVIFSFGGAELLGLTLRETKDAHKVLPKVLRGVVVRVSLFYILPILVIVGLVPWNQIGSQGSPFVNVLQNIGLSSAADVMNFVMLVAVISAANSGVYATSRMLFSLAGDGEAPKVFTRLSKSQVPVLGILVSAIFLFGGAAVAYFAPKSVFSILMGIPAITVLTMWIMICAAQLKLRLTDKDYHKPGRFLLKGFPYISGATVIAFTVILAIILFTPDNLAKSLLALGVVAFLFIASYMVKGKQT